MSLINGMLRDLEARKSDPGAGASVTGSPAAQQQVRVVPIDADRHWGRWYLLTGALFLALVAWIFLVPQSADKAVKALPPGGAAASLSATAAVVQVAPQASVPVADDKPAMPTLAALVPTSAADQKVALKAAVEEPRMPVKAAEPVPPKVAMAAEVPPGHGKDLIVAKTAAQALPEKHFVQTEETHPATLAMNSARLQLAKGDLHGAIDTIERSLPEGSDRSDYQAFLAALLQRDEQHKRAIEHFLLAVKKSPQTGVLWLGLGISRQALQQLDEAQEAFKRAKETSTLTPELQAFVDLRLAQMAR